jgi:uroporphyrin-III C-methyltransferase / precorrin-2 dehydrogenase / sirohydrochlorin ferrochelatase
VHSLPLFARLTGRNVILVGDGEAADAKRRLLVRAGAAVVGEDAQAALAIVAVEDDAEAEAAVARLKARGILVNAVDRVALCDFTLPAIIDRDPVIIAIGTAGASAGLAKALRQRLEALLPQSLGSLATGLFAARRTLRTKFPDGTARRQAIDAALSEGGLLDPFVDGSDIAVWLASEATETPDRTETLVLTSDDPDDLTLRQARQLASATTIYHSAEVPAAILDRARADATRVKGEAPDQRGSGLTLIVSI